MQGCVIGTPATCLGTSQALLTMKLISGSLLLSLCELFGVGPSFHAGVQCYS